MLIIAKLMSENGFPNPMTNLRQRMKAEFIAYHHYALELRLTIENPHGLLRQSDLSRFDRSLESKGYGFIRDLDDLCGDVRLALSTGSFRLSEHTRKVFRRARNSVLPQFLEGALSRVFNSDGSLRADYSTSTAAAIIRFLSAAKRIDPPSEHYKALEGKVWSLLRSNFEDEPKVLQNVKESLETDLHFRTIFFRARERFRNICSRAPIEVNLAFGPGKNLDRYESSTALDWYCAEFHSSSGLGAFEPEPIPPFLEKFFDELRAQINYAPKGTQVRHKYPIRRGEGLMRCSAQPKSYKALRGVGVTSALRMTCQLSLQRAFYEHALDSNLPLKDQSQMQENLRDNWGEIGTIDLSSASDRCYWSLLYAFGKGIKWFDACYFFRVKELELPTGRVPCSSPVMGEAITFPLMSAFFASIALAVCDYVGYGHDLVKVYGDDIQHPHYDLMIETLEKFGAKPSSEKSYPPHSAFKESCEAHYVGTDDAAVSNARPAYMPSWGFTPRGRMPHADIFKWLVLAKDAFMRDGAMSRAACSLVEKFTVLRLPDVPFNSPFLGRPRLKDNTSSYCTIQCQSEDGTLVSDRGLRRIQLRAREFSPDAKLSHKYWYRLMAKSVTRIKVRSDFLHLENMIFWNALNRHFPSLASQYESHDSKSLADCRSFALSVLSAEQISAEIQHVIELIQAKPE